jgi:hypothetical protein
MFRCHGTYAVAYEGHLNVLRLLAPERAIIIKDGNPVLGPDEVQRALPGHFGDEIEDCPLGRALIPGGEQVVSSAKRRPEENHPDERE